MNETQSSHPLANTDERFSGPETPIDRHLAELKQGYEKTHGPMPTGVTPMGEDYGEHLDRMFPQQQGSPPAADSEQERINQARLEYEHAQQNQKDRVTYSPSDGRVDSGGGDLGPVTIEETRATQQLQHELGAGYEKTIADAGRGAGKVFGSVEQMNNFLKANPELLRDQSFIRKGILALAKYGRRQR